MLKELMYTGPETSRKLKEQGILKKTNYYWLVTKGQKARLVPSSSARPSALFSFLPAFSLAELGEMIPWGFFQKTMVHKMPGSIWQVKLSDGRMHSFALEVEARAYFLIDLLRSREIKADEINHPEKYSSILPSGKPSPAINLKKRKKRIR